MSSSQVEQNVSGSSNVFTGTGDIHITNVQSAPAAADRRNLLALLRNVRQFWIEGVLQSSVHGAALLALDKQTAPDTVEHPWEMQLALPDATSRALPPEQAVVEVYEEIGRSLLILGEPGSGKTTTLLELARDLIAEAERNAEAPVPVVFLLSSWKAGQGFGEWLVSELNQKYGVSRKIAGAWLDEHRLAVLLDGLDEVPEDSRRECVEAIHGFASELPPSGLAVTCRAEEYARLGHRLRMRGAIRIQPLTPQQVETYLDGAGAPLAGLRAALAADPVLREMAASPLMLSIMSLAYRNTPVEALTDGTLNSPDRRRAHIFREYVGAAYRRKGREQPFGLVEINTRLAWLAQRLAQHGQTLFLLEQMQPSWLSSAWERWLYIFASRMVGFVAFFAAPAIMALPLLWEIPDLRTALLSGIGLSIFLALLCAARDIFAYEWESARTVEGESASSPSSLIARALALYGALLQLILFHIFWVRSRSRDFTTDIQPVEHVTVSLPRAWQAARKAGRWGGYAGLASGIFAMVAVGLDEFTGEARMDWAQVILFFCYPLFFMLLFGLPGALIAGMVSLVRAGTVETKSKANQGIYLSLRNGILAALAIGALGILTALAFFLAGSDLTAGIVFTAPYLVTIGFFTFGGQDAIQHGVLRVILVRRGCIPRRYDAFLDHGVKLVLLQRVGGGYRFVHRLLQEYFAKGEFLKTAASKPS